MDPSPSQSYRLEPRRADLRGSYTEAQLALLEKLNRADVEHLSRLNILVVPDRWDAGDLDYSPLPLQVPELIPHPKALVVHQPIQVFGAYEKGQLVRWGPVSWLAFLIHGVSCSPATACAAASNKAAAPSHGCHSRS